MVCIPKITDILEQPKQPKSDESTAQVMHPGEVSISFMDY